jgi:hypothetical protein
MIDGVPEAHPSPTSAKGSLRSPGLRILSHKGRGRLVALRCLKQGRDLGTLPLPLWERIVSPCEAKLSIWAHLVRGEATGTHSLGGLH